VSAECGQTFLLTKLGALTARPVAFLIFIFYVAGWLIFSSNTLDWQAVATLATWAMTLVIQRAEYRDRQAIQAKLDELLLVHKDAQNEIMNLDDSTAEDVERYRRKIKKKASR
jgi:low affinity Fe/Cu permease